MSTTSLYQKYRPQSFDQVIGQDQIVNTLKRQIVDKTFGHAYLFYGSRGLGKTTIARLVADELNIQTEDLYEIDAASNRGIDDIREIREGVKARPFNSTYKMYLIDEVHMLTKEAFNALLKTLEEPPSYVIFIMATTELHKVPDTIKSRSQVFTFKSPDLDSIKQLLSTVAKAENITIKEGELELIANRADGSYRDSLSELQKFISDDDYQSTVGHLQEFVTKCIDHIVEPTEEKLNRLVPDVKLLPDIKIAYTLILKEVSNRLFNKIANQEPEGVNSKSLQYVLEYRDYFYGSNQELIHRSGMLLLISDLLSTE